MIFSNLLRLKLSVIPFSFFSKKVSINDPFVVTDLINVLIAFRLK